jgi:DNA-binding MarR family transcriptional regulator
VTAPRAAASANGSSEVRSALDALRLIVQALRAGARAGQRRAGLSSAQLFALQQIADHPGASINDVAALTFTHQSSVSVVIERLVAQRLVVRVAASDDRRRRQLELTAAGRLALRRAPVAVQEKLVTAIAALPEADRRALARTLGQVARVLAPKGATTGAPMLFEETVPRRHPASAAARTSRGTMPRR